MQWRNKMILVPLAGAMVLAMPGVAGAQAAGAQYPVPGQSGSGQPAVAQPVPAPAPTATMLDGPPPSDGPQGSSQSMPGDGRYDAVGYAVVRGVSAGEEAAGHVVAIHAGLPAGSFVEVTALDTGHTILVLVTGQMDPGAGALIGLSPAAARQLGMAATTLPVRIRRVSPTAQDQAALLSGGAATPRMDAPEALLVPLRRRIPVAPMTDIATPPPGAQPAPGASFPPPGSSGTASPVTAAPTQPLPAQSPAAAAPARSGRFVQIAALSNLRNAQALAASVGGFVRSAGTLHRVQIGPFATAVDAERARADMARRGYPDARIVILP